MDFSQARFNMVKQQIGPAASLDSRLLDILLETPRENFLIDHQKPFAYVDISLPLSNNHIMLPPLVLAQMIDVLSIKPHDKVLEIGTGSGYVTALLSRMAQTVVTADIDAEQQQRARNALEQLGFDNIIYKIADGFTQAMDEAPYDAIYVGGACIEVPHTLKLQMAPKGKMVVIQGCPPAMTVDVYTREDENHWFCQTVFETCVPYLQTGNFENSHFMF